ncbi:MAG: HAMP domain-containing sensor histidine kinase [Gammaproteobacteria bacterium]
MRLERPRRLNTSLWRAFVLQIVLISATAVAGVYLAEFAIRELLIVSALKREADYFWARRKITADTPAPNTNTLIGYVFDDGSELPDEFAGLGAGIHDVTTPVGAAVVHVSEHRGARLFLVFDANNVKELATYFGLAPLALLLVVLYSSAWAAYRLTRRAVSPVIRLARSVRDIDLESPEFAALAADVQRNGGNAEIEVLTNALRHLLGRVDRFIERERLFTREASHELRSPLTVIRMASEKLLGRDDLDAPARALVEKMRRAALDMEELTEILLLLAREHEGTLVKERVTVNDIVRQEFNRCVMIYGHKPLTLRFAETHRVHVQSTPRVLAIVLGNLLRNACAYTERGTVDVLVNASGLRITDSGIGMSKEYLGAVFSPAAGRQHARGNGIGLSIVKRISERFDWNLEIESEPARGTTVTVTLGAVEATALVAAADADAAAAARRVAG